MATPKPRIPQPTRSSLDKRKEDLPGQRPQRRDSELSADGREGKRNGVRRQQDPRPGDVYVTRVTWSRILALYVTLAFLLTCDAFGTFIEFDNQRNKIIRMVIVIVPGGVHFLAMITCVIVFINACKETVFLRLGLYDMLRREFAPFVFSLVVSAALRLGILLVRLEWAFGIKPMPTWGAELASHVMGPLFVFERIAMLVFYMSAAEAIRKATSPQLYSRACLEARDASRQRVPEEDISF